MLKMIKLSVTSFIARDDSDIFSGKQKDFLMNNKTIFHFIFLNSF